MSEEPKSIWKKSWTGLRAWLLVSAATFFIVLIVTLLIPGGFRIFSWWPALIFTLVVSVVAAVCVGLLAFIHCFFCWRNFKRLLFGVACFATLIALFYAEEDWRGWHAWNQFKHEREAKGEKFDFASVVPPPVPDDQNFALTPIVFTSYGQILTRDGKAVPWEKRDTNFVNRLQMEIADYGYWPDGPTNRGNWQLARMSDLEGWQNYYRWLATKTNEFPIAREPQTPAQDVLLALSKYDSTIEELRQASQLPYSRFPLNYDSESPGAILLPHLAMPKRCTLVLRLRSLAELQNGQSEKALADEKLMLRLTDSVRTEPFLISHLVRIAMLQITLQPVWEGLAEHRWSNEQLVSLDVELAKLDFLADYKLSMRGELGCQNGIIDYLRQHPYQIQNFAGMSGGEDENRAEPVLPGNFAGRLLPAGWFYQNQLRCARMMVEFYIPLADVDQETVSPSAVRHADEVLRADTKQTTPYNILEKMLFPELGSAVKRFAYAQTSVDLARVAIALERYRLAHGEYPESLDALAPQFIAKLPHDIIGGQPSPGFGSTSQPSQGSGPASQPLHYRRDPPSPGSSAAGGQFVLYSVGWNETDDGGVVGLTKGGVVDINQGDWVWRYPAR